MIFVTEDDHRKPSSVTLSDEEEKPGMFCVETFL